MPISATSPIDALEGQSKTPGTESSKTKHGSAKSVSNRNESTDTAQPDDDAVSADPFTASLLAAFQNEKSGTTSTIDRFAPPDQAKVPAGDGTPTAVKDDLPIVDLFATKLKAVLGSTASTDIKTLIGGTSTDFKNPDKSDKEVKAEAGQDVIPTKMTGLTMPLVIVHLETTAVAQMPTPVDMKGGDLPKDTVNLEAVPIAAAAKAAIADPGTQVKMDQLNSKMEQDRVVFDGQLQQIATNVPGKPESSPSEVPASKSQAQAGLPAEPTAAAETAKSVVTQILNDANGKDTKAAPRQSRQIGLDSQAFSTNAITTDGAVSTKSAENNVVLPSSRAALLPIDQQAANSTLKTDLNMRIQGESGENVTVRLFERGGEIQMAIRSSDAATATAIRHEMPSLQAGLERAGWQMQENVTASSHAHAKDGSPDSSKNDEQSSRQGQQNSGAGQQQQRKNKTAYEQWIDTVFN